MVTKYGYSNSCVVCEYSISDPVCRECYIRQIEIFLNDMQMHPLAEEIILNKIKEKFPADTLNVTKCILCKGDNVILCRYCFSIILTRILREFNFTEEMIGDFGYTRQYDEDSLKKRLIKARYFF